MLQLLVDGDFFLKSYGDWWWQADDDDVEEHPLLAKVSDEETFEAEVAVDAEDVLGIVGLLPLELEGLEVSGLDDEFVGLTEGPGAVPTLGAGIFWQFGGSNASKK